MEAAIPPRISTDMPKHAYQHPNGTIVTLIISAQRETHGAAAGSLFHLWRGWIFLDRGNDARTELYKAVSPSTTPEIAIEGCIAKIAAAGWKIAPPEPGPDTTLQAKSPIDVLA